MTAFVVVGAGPAGVAAAVEAKRLGEQPLLLDALGRAGGTIRMAHEVRDVPFVADRANGEDVANGLDRFLRRWDIVVEHARLAEIRTTLDGLVLQTADREIVASKVVVALGTAAVLPQVPGLSGNEGVLVESAARACTLRVPGHALVIGGSDVAMDQARWLRARGVTVEVCARGALRAPAWLIESARRDGVVVHTETKVLGASMNGSRCIVAIDRSGRADERVVDVMVAAVGRRPVSVKGLAEAMARLPRRIRIAGDGAGRRARHVVAALGDGCVASAELLSAPEGCER